MEIGGIISGGITIQTDRQIGFNSAVTYSKKFQVAAPNPMYAATASTSASLSPGTSSFTFECWIYVPYVSANALPLFTRGGTTGAGTGAGTYSWGLTSDSQSRNLILSFIENTTEYLPDYVNSNLEILPNRWYHISVCRGSDNTLRGFVNGKLVQSTANFTNNLNTTGTSRIGRVRGTGTTYFDGYMSNLRFVNGTGLYTQDFFVPVEPLTAIANTEILTFQDKNVEWLDNSGTSFGWAWPTTARINSSAFSPFNKFGII